MFDSLTDQPRTAADTKESQREKLLHWGFIALVAIVIVGVLFLVIRFAS
jgi:bacteriorhodopsin